MMKKNIFKDKLRSCKELLLLQNTGMTNILEKRLVFERLDKIIKSNPELHVYNLFWDWYFYNYIDSQVMEIMRILDKDPDSKNLIRFLDSLASGFNIDSSFFEKIKNEFNQKIILNELTIELNNILPFDITKIEQDREALLNETSVVSVKNYRDWKVAHNDFQKWEQLNLSLVQLNECVDFLHKKILSYELSLNGIGYPDTGLLPHISYDWEKIFKIPWIMNIEKPDENIHEVI